MMFEVGKQYRNNNGEYTVLSIKSNQMNVQYRSGQSQSLDIATQTKIQERLYRETNPIQDIKICNRKQCQCTGSQAYWTMGFLFNRITWLGVNLAKKGASKFQQTYYDIKHKELPQDQSGVSYLRNGANQWGNQGVIRFIASLQELPLLQFSSDGNTPYASNIPNNYEIKDIRYLKFLLEHGFELGNNPTNNIVINSIPPAYINSFNQGISFSHIHRQR